MYKFILLITILSSCAFENANISRTIKMTTDDSEMQQYLTTSPVSFVAMPECDGPELGNDMKMYYPTGCYYAKENRIEVALVDWNRDSDWRYQDQIEETLRHEFCHAIQFKQTKTTWHDEYGNAVCK